jgi:cholesterol transport system auxiliary component
VRQTYLLEVDRTQASTATPLPGALLVGVFDVAEPYASRGMVYRFGDYRYESDFYNEFFVPPSDMISQRVLEWLQSARLYDTVVPLAGNRIPGGNVLQGLVNEMYADLRDATRPTALLTIQFYVTREQRRRGDVLFAEQLSQRRPMRDASAPAYAAALSEALAAILAELEQRMHAAGLAAARASSEHSEGQP